MSYIYKKVSSKDQVLNINETAAMTLGIEMALNGLDIGLPVTMTLGTSTILSLIIASVSLETILIFVCKDPWVHPSQDFP